MTDTDTYDEFEEGEEYEMDRLPDSDMTPSGNLEMVGDRTYGARYGDTLVTFVVKNVECIDVRGVDEVGNG